MNARRPAIPEVAESAASGEVAAVYADIRAQLRVPMVNLIYRHMASFPGLLRWAWASVHPAVADGTVVEAARAVADGVAIRPAAVIPTPALRALRVDGRSQAHVRAVFAAYNAANPCNLVVTSTVLRLIGEAGAAAVDGLPPAAESALPSQPGGQEPALDLGPDMIHPSEMPPATAALVASLPGGPGITPSLYRHLANWPELLAAEAIVLEPHRQELPAEVTLLRRQADEVAERLVADGSKIRHHRPPQVLADAGVDVRIGSFTPVIAAMVVVGKLFERALPGDP